MSSYYGYNMDSKQFRERGESSSKQQDKIWEAISQVELAIKVITKKYQAGIDDANWFNNNVDGVGHQIDYMAVPSLPDELSILKELLIKLKQ